MLYKYRAIDQTNGDEKSGTIDAATVDIAIAALQRRKFVIVSIVVASEITFWESLLAMGRKVSYREVVVLSRQISTLFHAQISALRVFQLLAQESENELLRRRLEEVAADIQGGSSLAGSLSKYPDVFSDFYVNMVRSGEESGDLSNTFLYLADYLDRSYELISKTRNALIYPAFVITVFVVVMILMLVIVIPKLSAIILETGKELPIYTKIVIGTSNFFVEFGILLIALLCVGGVFLYRFMQTTKGKEWYARFSLSLPYVGSLYKKLYLARISDNLNTMFSSGIAVVRALEISASGVGNKM